ncbi:hypothetical protein FA13DRAFT_1719562 [Coprinellus micaceus]|uniref:Uncharacterized protein n=1 Tax=Coprinellus micaceus TaxID=71717 RepID=A0A4Y7SBC6_COPMI|nr:hypothetical protein FA13DRAFT_1719562 [Coprinellus micaceus]
MSQNPGLPADRPLETIPPRMVSTPSSMDDLTEQAQEFERYILKHRRDATLEGVLSTALVGQPSFEVACKRLGEPQGKLPALKRLRADLANGRPFAAYMEWLEKKVVVKKPALAPQQLAPAKPVSDRPPALKSTPGPRSKRRRRKVTGKAITVGVVHSPLKAKGGLSYKCLYPNSKAPVCIICKARKRPCVCNERRALLDWSRRRKCMDPNCGSAAVATAKGQDIRAMISQVRIPLFFIPRDGLTIHARQTKPHLDRPRQTAERDTALQAELEQVASRLRSVQDIISAIDGSDDVIRALTPLIGDGRERAGNIGLAFIFRRLGPLPRRDRQCEPFKQLIERFVNLTNDQLAPTLSSQMR